MKRGYEGQPVAAGPGPLRLGGEDLHGVAVLQARVQRHETAVDAGADGAEYFNVPGGVNVFSISASLLSIKLGFFVRCGAARDRLLLFSQLYVLLQQCVLFLKLKIQRELLVDYLWIKKK